MKGFAMTEADAIAHAQRHGLALDPALTVRPGAGPAAPDGQTTCPRTPRRTTSKTELRYATLLELAQHEGRIKAWWPCPLRLWIAPAMSYTSDFLTQARGPDVLSFPVSQPITLSPAFAESLCRFGSYGLTLIEVKHTFMFDRRRALDRLKTAAGLYPMLRFKLCIWDAKRQTFVEQEIPAL
jgi:hypothetical protein